MTAETSTAQALGFSRSGQRQFRFPCGHIEPEVTVGDRLRRLAGAVLVRCRTCNVIALTIPVDRGSLTTRSALPGNNRG